MKRQNLIPIFTLFRQYNKPFDILHMPKPSTGKVLWPAWWSTAYKKWINGKYAYVDASGKHVVYL